MVGNTSSMGLPVTVAGKTKCLESVLVINQLDCEVHLEKGSISESFQTPGFPRFNSFIY